MDSAVEVRRRHDTDLRPCRDGLRRCHEVDRYPGAWPPDPVAWLSPPSLLGAWVATVGGRVRGHVALTAGAAHATEVRRLFVTPDAQGRGLAVALLEAATRHAATGGAHGIDEPPPTATTCPVT